MKFHPDDLPDLAGKVYIVTGGNSGIGYWTVARLAQHGAKVYLCARSPEKGEAAVASIREMCANSKVTLLRMDHMDLSNVVSAAKLVASQESAVNGLINNAGIMATPVKISKDGYEAQWQTNHVAHWVFTYQLLPVMLATAKALPPGSVRIVNLSSVGHVLAPKEGTNLTDASLPGANGMTRYGQSKLANIYHAKMLHQHYGPVSPHAKEGKGEIWTAIVHPGLVSTNLDRRSGINPVMKGLGDLFGYFGASIRPDKGSWTSVFCAASPKMKIEQSGTYFQRIAEPRWESSKAKDMDLAAKLEEWTEQQMRKDGWLD